MIDLHCHVLPKIDDGPRTMQDTLALVHAAIATGTKTIIATPHVSSEFPANTAQRIADKCADVNKVLLAERLDLEVRPGAEVAVDHAPELADDELSRLTLGGGPWLLVEPPLAGAGRGVAEAFHAVAARGVRVVVAHPERAECFQRDTDALRELIDAGMLAQVTAGSIAGRFGKTVQRFAIELVREGLAHNVASDAHSTGRRSPTIGPELIEHGLDARADWLTRAVPLALLQGTALPPAPDLPPAPKRGLRRLLR